MEIGSKVIFNGLSGIVREYRYPDSKYIITGYAEVIDDRGNLIYAGPAGVLKEIEDALQRESDRPLAG